MIKAIFLDIDGTLVSFKTHQIPTSTIEALKAVHAKGVKLFIATGRPSSFINNINALEELGIIDGYITMNGSCCKVGDDIIYKKPIPINDATAIIEYCEDNNYTCVLVGEEEIKVLKPSDFFVDMFYKQLKVMKLPNITIDQFLIKEGLKNSFLYDIYQLSPFFDYECEKELSAKIQNCEISRWTGEFADIGAKGNTKQLGIDKIIEHFGFDLSETMSFGDGGNDITMLKHAAIGVAMGNARDEIKAVADYVTTSVDDDGIKNALIHFNIL